jgi:hypothetical protein
MHFPQTDTLRMLSVSTQNSLVIVPRVVAETSAERCHVTRGAVQGLEVGVGLGHRKPLRLLQSLHRAEEVLQFL